MWCLTFWLCLYLVHEFSCSLLHLCTGNLEKYKDRHFCLYLGHQDGEMGRCNGLEAVANFFGLLDSLPHNGTNSNGSRSFGNKIDFRYHSISQGKFQIHILRESSWVVDLLYLLIYIIYTKLIWIALNYVMKFRVFVVDWTYHLNLCPMNIELFLCLPTLSHLDICTVACSKCRNNFLSDAMQNISCLSKWRSMFRG